VNSVVAALATVVFAFVLICAAVPGLIMGIPIGLLVRSKSKSWKWCLGTDVVGATLYAVVANNFGVGFVMILVALLPWIFFGRWVGYMLRPPGNQN
jgi:hypothetical protein